MPKLLVSSVKQDDALGTGIEDNVDSAAMALHITSLMQWAVAPLHAHPRSCSLRSLLPNP